MSTPSNSVANSRMKNQKMLIESESESRLAAFTEGQDSDALGIGEVIRIRQPASDESAW
jgi:hypothetical protein